MNVKQLAFVNLLAGWCQEADCLVAASYAVIGNQLNVTPVAAFLRTKTLEKHGWVKRKDGKLYLHPKFSKGSDEQWAALTAA
jgi:DNA-binding IclR family transcriptional regulator